jgi:hypothetical protein
MDDNRINRGGGLLLGILLTLLVMLLLGAVRHDYPTLPVAVVDGDGKNAPALSSIGRYHIAAWGSGGDRSGGIFVLDTVTGQAKMAYGTVRDANGKTSTVDHLGKPFSQM